MKILLSEILQQVRLFSYRTRTKINECVVIFLYLSEMKNYRDHLILHENKVLLYLLRRPVVQRKNNYHEKWEIFGRFVNALENKRLEEKWEILDELYFVIFLHLYPL